jgi:hypothetical protein
LIDWLFGSRLSGKQAARVPPFFCDEIFMGEEGFPGHHGHVGWKNLWDHLFACTMSAN